MCSVRSHFGSFLHMKASWLMFARCIAWICLVGSYRQAAAIHSQSSSFWYAPYRIADSLWPLKRGSFLQNGHPSAGQVEDCFQFDTRQRASSQNAASLYFRPSNSMKHTASSDTGTPRLCTGDPSQTWGKSAGTPLAILTIPSLYSVWGKKKWYFLCRSSLKAILDSACNPLIHGDSWWNGRFTTKSPRSMPGCNAWDFHQGRFVTEAIGRSPENGPVFHGFSRFQWWFNEGLNKHLGTLFWHVLTVLMWV